MKRFLPIALLLSVIAPGAWANWNSGQWGVATWEGSQYVVDTQPSWLSGWDRQGFLHRHETDITETEANLLAGSWYIRGASYVHQPFERVLVLADATVSTVTTSCSIVLVPYIQGYNDAEPYRLDADAWTITTTGTGQIQRALYWDYPDGEPYFWACESVTNGVVDRMRVYIRPTED